MERSQLETVCASKPAALQPVPVPSSALLARLAPLTSVPGRPDLVAHHAPDVIALWQAFVARVRLSLSRFLSDMMRL